jgi:replicative DNA helicase
MKKAFEGEDILSEECEQIRQEILKIQETGKKAKKEFYVKLFDCINNHIEEIANEKKSPKI